MYNSIGLFFSLLFYISRVSKLYGLVQKDLLAEYHTTSQIAMISGTPVSTTSTPFHPSTHDSLVVSACLCSGCTVPARQMYIALCQSPERDCISPTAPSVTSCSLTKQDGRQNVGIPILGPLRHTEDESRFTSVCLRTTTPLHQRT